MPDELLNNEQIEPSSPQPINTTGSESSNMPPEAPESPKNTDIPVSLNNANPKNELISTPNSEEAKPEELPTEGEKTEETSKPVQTSETRTAQIPANEPLNPKPEPLESAPVSAPQPQPISAPAPVPVFVEPQQNKISLARELLVKARNAIQFRKRKKLDRVMTLFLKQSKITNNEVKDFLHVSDATAERYLNALEKENKIKQVGKTGKGVSYSRI